MFQNINVNVDDTNINSKAKINFKKIFTINDIVLYVISFMASMVSFKLGLAPFGLAVFAAFCSTKIPAGVAYIVIALGTLVGFGINGLLTFILTSLVFIALILIFKPKYETSDRNEKRKLGIFVFVSTFAVQAGKMFFTMFLVYDLISSFMLAVITYIFYKIFSNSLVVIKEYGKKTVFTIEEVMGASLLISIAIASISKLQIFSLSITNILSIMLVLFLGWQHGMLVGATAGITIGMVLRNNNIK